MSYMKIWKMKHNSEKLEKFKKRNRRRNKHLYKKGLKEGYDYIICPVSKERISMIKSSYITKVLDMSVEEYDKKYPNQQKCCKKRGENLSKGLKKINPKTGIRRSIEIQQKARKTLTKIGEDGLTGDEKRAIKTKESNFNNIVDGKNGYQRTAEKARPKQIKTMSEQGKIAKYNNRNHWEIYKKFVWFLTNKNKPNTNKTIGKGIGKYSLDHKISVCYGFNNKISPFLISSKENMEYIKFEDNCSKWTDNSINEKELFEKTNYTKENNDIEYYSFYKIMKKYVKERRLYSNYEFETDIINETKQIKKQ